MYVETKLGITPKTPSILLLPIPKNQKKNNIYTNQYRERERGCMCTTASYRGIYIYVYINEIVEMG